MKRTAVIVAVLATLGIAGVASAKMTTRTYTLNGVKTQADQQKVEKAVTRLPGVSHATTRHNSLTVTYDTKKVTESKVRSAVDRAGPYKMAKPAKHGAKHRARRGVAQNRK